VLTVSASGIQDSAATPARVPLPTRGSWTPLGPTVTDVVDVTPDPRNTSVSSVDVVLSEQQFVTFHLRDLTLTLMVGGGALQCCYHEFLCRGRPTASRSERLHIANGTYLLTVNASGIQDLVGNSGTGSAIRHVGHGGCDPAPM